MSIIEHPASLSNPDLLIPTFKTEVFRNAHVANYWLGTVATAGELIDPQAYAATGVLRANIYIDEQGFLPASARLHDGTERDEADPKSHHFAVLERDLTKDGVARAVGTARLIKKQQPEEALPIESLFPEAFDSEAAPVGSVEASRYISRHQDKLVQNMIALSLIRSMVLEASTKGSPYIYAVVEDHLLKSFKKIGLPLAQIGEAKMLEEYSTKNMPLRFNPNEILTTAAEDVRGERIMTHYFRNNSDNLGQGFYDSSFMAPQTELAA